MSEADDGGEVSVDVDVGDDRTLVRVAGERRVAVIVESAAGERIYLPPEDFDEPEDAPARTPYDSPYDGVAGETPYDAATGDESPYDSGAAASQPLGVQSTADGFRILHPEPVTDLRVLR